MTNRLLGKKHYAKPLMCVESFTPNEYVSACDFDWKYTGTEVKGNDIHQGTYNSRDDHYNYFGNWVGDNTVKSSPFGPHEFLTNSDLGATVGAGGFYSTSKSNWGLFSGYDTNVDDPTVFRYSVGGTYYYSGDLFERERNYS